MDLSIVISYHNEGADFISASLISILESIRVISFEIIIVDDGSIEKLVLSQFPNVKIIRHKKNLGVGAAFDTGVAEAKSENLFLMGCDVRFPYPYWEVSIVSEIIANPKSFICTSCVRLSGDGKFTDHLDIENGATIQIRKETNRPRRYKDILITKWLPRLEERRVCSFEIPCILGAAYGVSKSWYNYVDGFSGHRYWGTLEPYISLKSWMFGGSCRVAPDIKTGHIFDIKNNHLTPREYFIYNKIFTFIVLFDDHERFVEYVGGNGKVDKAKILIEQNKEFIFNKKKEYFNKTIVSAIDFLDRWKIYH
jgi:glycosyltransferase involved in cell wall biosynthesis